MGDWLISRSQPTQNSTLQKMRPYIRATSGIRALDTIVLTVENLRDFGRGATCNIT
jgi:hypothetical protein